MTILQGEWLRQNIQKILLPHVFNIKVHNNKERGKFRTFRTCSAHDLDHQLEELVRLIHQSNANEMI